MSSWSREMLLALADTLLGGGGVLLESRVLTSFGLDFSIPVFFSIPDFGLDLVCAPKESISKINITCIR